MDDQDSSKRLSEAHRKHAQTLSLISFLVIGALLYWLGHLIPLVRPRGLGDFLEIAHYLVCFFAVFTLPYMSDYFYSRLTR